MATCDFCGTMIVFGGVKDGDRRYCNAKCRDNGHVAIASGMVPDEMLWEYVAGVHQGPCPRCGREGPVDVHMSHHVLSFFVMTSWSSKPHICCRRCGVKSKLTATATSGLFGWWGFPWGFLVTPVQIARNLGALFRRTDPALPSP